MFKKTFEEIVDLLSFELEEYTSIHCGHHYFDYDSSTGKVNPIIDEISLTTLKIGLSLYELSKQRNINNVRLSFLVGDLSIHRRYRQDFKQSFSMSAKYLSLITEQGIDESDIDLFFESTLRNRADKQLKRGIKSNSLINYKDAYHINPLRYEGLADRVSNVSPNKKPVPICRLMLSQELVDREKKGFRKAINICNSHLYECKGRYALVYRHLMKGKMDVVNAYLIYKTNNHYVVDFKKY